MVGSLLASLYEPTKRGPPFCETSVRLFGFCVNLQGSSAQHNRRNSCCLHRLVSRGTWPHYTQLDRVYKPAMNYFGFPLEQPKTGACDSSVQTAQAGHPPIQHEACATWKVQPGPTRGTSAFVPRGSCSSSLNITPPRNVPPKGLAGHI